MLRKIRITLAAVFLTGITLLLFGFGAGWLGWMAKIQIVPSCMAMNFAVLLFFVMLTLVFGRVYCSVVCPLGVLQDLSLRIRQGIGRKLVRIRAKRGAKPLAGAVKKFAFHPERPWLRYAVMALFIAGIIAGTQVAIALIAPYSTYGRMIRSVIEIGSGHATLPLVIVGAVSFIAIVALAAAYGRAWCNNICPVGSFLGIFSRFSLFRPVIDEDKCISCHSCGKVCRAGCIDSQNRTIDTSRCIDCMDCIDDCKAGAIGFRPVGWKRKPASTGSPDESKGRRAFLGTAAFLATAGLAEAQNIKLDGGLAPLKPRRAPERAGRLVPFGAGSVKDFYSRCTACQLCVSNCPNGVLNPSTDPGHLLQPQMNYENGFCRPECTICSDICPAGAIRPVKAEEKLSIHIGTAKVDLSLCLVNRDDIDCGNCARHCPAGAIRMVGDGAHKIPAVIEDRCIGCGACEYLCPVRPVSAITVDGLETHRNS